MTLAPVMESNRAREASTALAPLFRYPDHEYSRWLTRARRVLSELDPDAARALDAFAEDVSEVKPGELQATYTSTFDLAPSCSPYLGVHLFGDEARDRARLLVGLRGEYAKRDTTTEQGELPDHVAEVLSFANEFGEKEWSDLVQLVLAPALRAMDGLLSPSTNPYRHLIAAARHLSAAAEPTGGES